MAGRKSLRTLSKKGAESKRKRGIVKSDIVVENYGVNVRGEHKGKKERKYRAENKENIEPVRNGGKKK